MPDTRDNPEREGRILDAAKKLFSHYGFDKTTVSDIADEAGISKGAVYLHFKSKDELFDALLLRESDAVLDDLLRRLDADREGGSIFGLYQHAILTSIANPLMHALMTRDSRVLGDYARRISKTLLAAQGNLVRDEMVKQLQAAGVIRPDLDADVVSYVLALIRYGFLMIHEVVPPDKAPPLDEVGRTLGLLLERGLAPEGGSNKEAGRQVLHQIVEQLRAYIHSTRKTSPPA